MKRVLAVLPWLGLAALLAALFVRGSREEGLALEPFPAPPVVELAQLARPLPAASLAGTVLAAGGEPVAEAFVVVSLDGELAWDYTDEEGHFEIAGVPAGERVVDVAARTYRTRSFAALSPDASLVLDLGEAVAPAPELPPITRGHLLGELEEPTDGRRLEGYEVFFLPVAPPDRFGAPVPARSPVGVDRTFRVPDLVHGEYRIAVLPPWALGGSWPNLCDPADRTFTFSGDTGPLRITLSRGEIEGRLADRQGDFVEGAVILVHPEGVPEHPWPPVSSDTDGAFVVHDLPPGTYRIELCAGNARYGQSVPVRAGGVSKVDAPPLDL